MAALCQNHWTAALRVGPVAAHETVSEVPVGEVLVPLEGHSVTQSTAGNELVYGLEERGITQHVTDLEDASVSLGGVHQIDTLGRRRRHRLLQQHVIASIQERQGAGVVRPILGCVYGCLAELRQA